MQDNLQNFTYKQPRQCARIMLLVGLFVMFSALGVPANLVDTTNSIVAAQTATTGEWTAELKSDNTIQLSLNRRTEKGKTSVSGNSIVFSELQGLSREQASGAKSDVNFRLVREAGTFDFAGTFESDKGAGSFSFSPTQSFLEAMRARGFAEISEEKRLAAALLDVRTKTIDDLKAAGFNNLDLEDVFKATIFKITPEFISEMRAIGYDNLDMEELVKARIFKITAQFAKEVSEMGLGRQPMESLVKMRIFKITPEFLKEMRATGLANLDIEDLVKFRIFKIDATFIQQTRSSGYNGSDAEEFVRRKIHGIGK